jgi:hypothetical protein
MKYKEIMNSHNMYEAMMILADRCREKDIIIEELAKNIPVEEPKVEPKVAMPTKKKVK